MTNTIEKFIQECQAADWASKRVLEDEFPHFISTLKALYRELEEKLQPGEKVPILQPGEKLLNNLDFLTPDGIDFNGKKISSGGYIDNILNRSTTVSGTYGIIIQLAIFLEGSAKKLKKELNGKYILTST